MEGPGDEGNVRSRDPLVPLDETKMTKGDLTRSSRSVLYVSFPVPASGKAIPRPDELRRDDDIWTWVYSQVALRAPATTSTHQ